MNIRKFRGFLALSLALSFPAASAAAVNFFNPKTGAPALLSQTGVYISTSAKTVDTAMNYFEVNAALWSDGASKKRWIILPPGKRVTYVDTTDYFDYPDSTIFVKNFYLDTVLNDSTTRKYWETRLLVNRQDENGKDYWYGFTYRWKADGSDADKVGSGGLDTTFNFYPKGVSQGLSYKKWTFPSASACIECHKVGTAEAGNGGQTARGVLGFFPVQLKRLSSIVPGTNQIDVLFDSGVFTGTRPNVTEKQARWKGIGEALPPTSQPDLRFRTLDTMARAYIAANCSGCHGTRNITVNGSAPFDLNYDFYQLKPIIEFGSQIVGSAGVDVTDEDTTVFPSNGRYKYVVSARRAGLPVAQGAVWDMGIPPEGLIPTPTLISAGHPALSMILYRQLALRRPPWRDSISALQTLNDYDPNNWKPWLFTNPWGSQAWRNDIATHSLTLSEVLAGVGLFGTDGLQMPPLATHIPDTAAMKILGEWAKSYRTLYSIKDKDSIVNVKGSVRRFAAENARIQNRQLIVPEGWSGKAQMFSVGGRMYALSSVGKGRYAIPQAAPSGLYFFKVGNRTFRASVLK
jgi:hypothetical protein